VKNFSAFVLMSAFETYLPTDGVEWVKDVKKARILSAAEVLLLMQVHENCAAIRVTVGYEPENLIASADFSSSLTAECVGQGRAA
jgi:hypothetical protein